VQGLLREVLLRKERRTLRTIRLRRLRWYRQQVQFERGVRIDLCDSRGEEK
jgi:hypothetical protein